MKYLIFFSICVLTFSSCQSSFINGLPRQYYADNQKIVNIRTKVHHRNIPIYHFDEQVEKPHLKVAILEAVGDLNVSYVSLILQLKEQAKAEGFDAIALFKQDINQRDYIDSEGYGFATNVKEVVAYGIIYKENLNLNSHFLKTEVVYGYNNNKQKYEELAVKHFDISENIIEVKGQDKLSKIVRPYSIKHLMTETDGWTFYQKNNRVENRRYENKTGLTKVCHFSYDSLGRIEEISIALSQEKIKDVQFFNQKINLIYDEKNRLFRKIIYPDIKDKSIFYEEIFLYENDGLKEKVLYSINNQVRNPIAKFLYLEYYTLEDLEAIFPELQ